MTYGFGIIEWLQKEIDKENPHYEQTGVPKPVHGQGVSLKKLEVLNFHKVFALKNISTHTQEKTVTNIKKTKLTVHNVPKFLP